MSRTELPKRLLDQTKDLIWMIDQNFNLVYANQAYLSWMKEITGKQKKLDDPIFVEGFDAGYIQKWKVYYQRAIQGEHYEIEEHFYHPETNEVQFSQVTFRPIVGDNQKIVAVACQSKDITDKIEEQHRLKLLESVITNTKDAVLITEAEPFDEPGPRIIYVNEAFTKMTGYTAEEVIGKTPRILQGPNSDKEELKMLSSSLRNWEPCEITVINYKKNGEEFWINFSVTPVANNNGRFTHWIAIERDVTIQKNKELEFRLISQLRKTFNWESDFDKASRELCKAVGLYVKLDWVELWTSNLEKTEIHLINYYVSSPEDENFYTKEVSRIKFSKNQSLVGKVWSSGKQIIWNDLSLPDGFERVYSVKRIGLKSIVGIPLTFDNEVLGVLTVGVKSNSGHLENYASLFNRLDKFIGSELQRKLLESDLNYLFDTIPDIVSVGDFQGKILKINKAGHDLLGYEEDELLYQGIEKLVHPKDLDIIHNEMELLQAGKNISGSEIRFFTKTGETLWFSWFAKANVNEELIYVAAKNITEEKKLKELYRQSRKLAKIGSWEVNLVNRTLYWSEEVHQLHETDPQTFVPDLGTAINFYREDFRPMVQTAIEKSITIGEAFDFEAVLVTANLKELWVRAIGVAEFVDNKCTRIFGSFQDIHEKKVNELELKSTIKKLKDYQFALDQSTSFTMTDAEGIITDTNDKFCKHTQFSREELIGNSHQLIKSEYHSKDYYANLWQTITAGNIWRGEVCNRKKDGTLFWADMTIVPFLDSQHKPFQYLAFRIDVTDRKIAEEQLAKALEDASRVLESIGDAFFAVDKNWIITYWNKEAEKVLGRKREEIIGTNLWEVYPDIIVTNFHQQLLRAIETGESVNSEEYYATLKKWFEVSAYPSKEGLSVYLKDITKRVKLEHERTSLFKTLENSLNEIYIFDSETLLFSYINKGGLLNLGYSAQEIKSLTPLNLKPELTESSFRQLISPLLNNEKEKIIFFTDHKRKDGSIYPVEVHLQTVPEGDKKRCIAIILDITERKKSEVLLDKANRLAIIGNWELDLEKSTVFWSPVTREIHDADNDYVPDLSKGINFYKEGESRNRIKQCVENCINLGEPWDEELEIVTVKENPKWVRVIGQGEFRDGICFRIYGSFQDITERKNQEEQLVALNESLRIHAKDLERSNEELEQFAFITSHDLQEPLRMIAGFMDQLKRKYSDQLDEKALQYIHFATDGAKRMRQIILDLLEYSRAGRPTNSMEQVNVNEVLSEFKQLRRKIIADKLVTISAPELPDVYSFRIAITQIFFSLLDNAIKYSKQGVNPQIEISAEEHKNKWQFAVKDNGIGIDSNFFNKIFIIFQRLHNRSEYDGTGIGLSIAKKHVEFLGGEIWVESKQGEGSTFYFTILKQDQPPNNVMP